ncbi:hypothetical protein OM076_38725 [Solirubrobacter ginsenosidimutans]|uniref:IPT/TIG domain-containing protein n=1 Tax=Solirubrobacter ginsenosidimutans TaxID=490573 RepID=A0A9X3N0L6_9ACTN|nr:hypothetical protein [Solirubrobacter ginsenosidimutans]MDA0166264.1 hypothetical protein [Solirubrobacter ginsenosidimutans]
MTGIALNTPVLDDGIDNVNFFNGRVLTAEDLRDEQRAGLEHRRRLGRAQGWGVVGGLGVLTGSDRRSVHVEPGLALDALGDVIELGTAVDVALVVSATGDASGGASAFAPCASVPTAPVVSGTGFYLLTISQAAGPSGRAAAVGFGAGGVAADCGARYTVEGVAFRLVALDIAGMADSSGLDEDARSALLAAAGSAARLRTRNVLAHLLLDTGLIADENPTPSSTEHPGALATLRGLGRLTDCDVPIAVVAWSGGQIEFLDGPAASRTPVPLTSPSDVWAAFQRPRRTALRVAASAQFQTQARELATRPDAGSLQARQYMRFLPAAGLLPDSFDYGAFATGMSYVWGGWLAPDRIERLVRDSLAYPPIDVAAGELIWFYSLAVGDNVTETVFLSRYLAPDYWYGDFRLRSVEPSRAVAADERVILRGAGIDKAAVFVGDVKAEVRKLSDDAVEVTLPPLDIPDGGERLDVRVRAGGSEQVVSLPVLPAKSLAGDLQLTRSEQRPAGGRVVNVTYTVRSDLNTTADVALEADAELAGGLVDVHLDPPVLEAMQPGEEREVSLSARVAVGPRIALAPNFRVTLRANAEHIEATDVLEGGP